ncbi:ATP-grasp domain-containing protein [Longispora sp. K20-0274]|uniref:ATP-grasp domain-containing protein n=1 Tax=Longispora sp. K20-0274 TaxID=3088255 RepID=UPI00399C2851
MTTDVPTRPARLHGTDAPAPAADPRGADVLIPALDPRGAGTPVLASDPRGAGVLVLPARANSTGELLADAAVARGMTVARIAGRPVPDGLRDAGAHLYAGPRLVGAVAGDLGIAPVEPLDGWLAELPGEFRGRAVRLTTLGAARDLTGPAFVKQPREKDLPARVYEDGGRLPAGDPDTVVLVSEVVRFVVEYRLFVLDGVVRTGSRYLTFGQLDPVPLSGSAHREAVTDFAARLLDGHGHTLPSAVVVDVGLLAGDGGRDARWGVVEANMAWYSHAYAADVDRVLDVVLRAAGPVARLADRDRAFVRAAPGRPERRADPVRPASGAGSPG